MKLLLIGLVLLLAWNAGYWLLAAICLAGLALMGFGHRGVEAGNIFTSREDRPGSQPDRRCLGHRFTESGFFVRGVDFFDAGFS